MSDDKPYDLREERDALQHRVKELEEKLSDEKQKYISVISHLEGPLGFECKEPGIYQLLLKVFPSGYYIETFTKAEQGRDIYPCMEWREFQQMFRETTIPPIVIPDFDDSILYGEQSSTVAWWHDYIRGLLKDEQRYHQEHVDAEMGEISFRVAQAKYDTIKLKNVEYVLKSKLSASEAREKGMREAAWELISNVRNLRNEAKVNADDLANHEGQLICPPGIAAQIGRVAMAAERLEASLSAPAEPSEVERLQTIIDKAENLLGCLTSIEVGAVDGCKIDEATDRAMGELFNCILPCSPIQSAIDRATGK